MSTSHIGGLLAIGAIVPMQFLGSRRGLAETLGNGQAPGFAAIGISDSDAGAAHASAIGGIAIGPDSFAQTADATHPCVTGGSHATDCGKGNIAIGTSSETTNDFAAAAASSPMPAASTLRPLAPTPWRAARTARLSAMVQTPWATAAQLMVSTARQAGLTVRPSEGWQMPWGAAALLSAPRRLPTATSPLPSALSPPRRTQQLRWAITRTRAPSMPSPSERPARPVIALPVHPPRVMTPSPSAAMHRP